VKVRMVNRGNYQSFVDDDNGGARILSVTRITAALPKDALINWAAEATAEYAVDHWDELSKMAVGARLNKLKKGRYESTDKAKQSGTDVHKFGERLLKGETVVVPPELTGYVNSYVRFMEDFDFHPVHVEQAVYSKEHAYAGRLDIEGDLILPALPEYDDIPRDEQGYSRALIDAKKTKSGIFGETALQLTGYRFADTMILDDGEHVARDSVDATFGLHIREDGYDLIRVASTPDVFRKFLYLKQVAHLAVEDNGSEMKALVMGRVPPPLMAEYVMVPKPKQEGAPF
jgi:hypothetical protein